MLIYQKTLQRYYFYFEKANFSKDFYFRKVIFAHFFTFAKVNRSNPLCQRSFALLSCRAQLFFLYYYSFSFHFRSHLVRILNVTVGFLSLLYLFLFGLSLFLFCTKREQVYYFHPATEDEYFFLCIAFEWFHIFGIFGYFLTLMEMTSLMTGFILNGLSESLLSSRLFRIKAWVLQVPFLSMIFLYFFLKCIKRSLFFFCKQINMSMFLPRLL